MPNWCYTEITIVCKKEKYAKDIHDTLLDWLKKDIPGHPEITRGSWLGKLIINSGLADFDTLSDSISSIPYLCRGQLTSIYQSGKNIVLNTETAWVPMMRFLFDILDKYWPNKIDDIFYKSEEPGCGLFYTNSPDYDDLYHAYIYSDVYNDLELSCDIYNSSGLIEELHLLLGDLGIFSESTDLNDLIEEFGYFDINLYVNQYEYLGINVSKGKHTWDLD